MLTTISQKLATPPAPLPDGQQVSSSLQPIEMSKTQISGLPQMCGTGVVKLDPHFVEKPEGSQRGAEFGIIPIKMSATQISELPPMCGTGDVKLDPNSVTKPEGSQRGAEFGIEPIDVGLKSLILARISSYDDDDECDSISELSSDVEDVPSAVLAQAPVGGSGVLKDDFKWMDSADVVIPHYHAAMTLAEIKGVYDGLLAADQLRMSQFGYPPFLLSRIRRCAASSTDVLKYARLRQARKQTSLLAEKSSSRESAPDRPSVKSHAGASSLVRQKYSKGEVARLWILHPKPCAPHRKPEVFSQSLFKNWVEWEAYRLRDEIKKPSCIITGNEAARVLFYSGGHALTKERVHDLLSRARIFVCDTNQEGVDLSPSTVSMGASLRIAVFTFGTMSVGSLNEAILAKDFLHKHKPAWKALVAYFEGDTSIDAPWLQRLLWRLFPPVSGEGLLGSLKDLFKGDLVVTHKHQVSVGLSQSTTEMLQRFLEYPARVVADSPIASTLVNIGATIVCIVEAKDWKGSLAAVAAFVSSKPAVMQYAAARLDALYSTVTRRQGLFSNIFASVQEDLSKLWALITGCFVTSILKETIGNSFPSIAPLVGDLVNATRREVLKDSAARIATSILDWVKDVIRRISECISERSLDPLWGPKWSSALWLRQGEVLVRHYTLLTIQHTNQLAFKEIANLRESQDVGPEWVEPVSVDEYLRRVENHIKQGQELVVYHRDDVRLVAKLMQVIQSLKTHADKLHIANVTAGERIAPMAIYYYGKAGVGKTNLARQVSQALGRMCNIPVTSDTIYEWDSGANFQDRLTHTTNVVIMDDVDHSVSGPSPGVASHVENFIQLVNNKPFPVEKADLSEKGMVFAAPVLVNYCSNFFDMRVSEYSLVPEAALRRIAFHVEVQVKPEFAKDDGQLDPVKAEAGGTCDMFDLTVRTYERRSKNFFSEGEKMSLPTFMKTAVAEFEARRARELRRLQGRASSEGACVECGLLLCPCRKDSVPANDGTFSAQFGDAFSLTSQPSVERDVYSLSSCESETPSMTRSVGRITAFIALMEQAGTAIRTRADLRWVLKSVSEAFHHGDVQFPIEEERTLRARFSDRIASLATSVRDLLRSPLPSGYFSLSEVPVSIRRRFRNPSEYFSTLPNVTSYFSAPVDWKREVSWGQAAIIGATIASSLIVLKLVLRAITTVGDQVVTQLEGRDGNVPTSYQVPPSWRRVDQQVTGKLVSKPFSQATWTYEQLVKDVATCTVEVGALVDGVFFRTMYGVVFGHNLIAVPTHSAANDSDLYVRVRDVVAHVRVNAFSRKVFSSQPEMCLVKVANLPAMPNLLSKSWFSEDDTIQSFDELHIVGREVKYTPSINAIVKHGQTLVVKTNAITEQGDCGLLYCAKHNNSWRVVAMHFASIVSETTSGTLKHSIGGIITANELTRLATSMAVTLQSIDQLPVTMTQYPDQLELGKMGIKSEVWAAQSHHGAKVFSLGALSPPLPGSTMKTKIRRSVWADVPWVQAFAAESCGRPDYWKFPEFRGRMIGDVWESPFTEMFAVQNFKCPRDEYMWLALADYLSAIPGLDCEGYSFLTREQAVYGVPGSVIGSVNMKTSVGPPLTGNKRGYIFLEDGKVDLEDHMKIVWDEVEQGFRSYTILGALAVCSLKDEPIKHTKAYTRVFNNMPAAFNLAVKQFSSPVKAFMRANWRTCECLVGVNMTSSDCNRLVDQFRQVDPTLTHLVDGDAKMLDKAWSGAAYDYTGLCFYALATALNLDPGIMLTIVHSLKHTVYSVKNDLFETVANPSGNDMTVELNSVFISLGERYVYYRQQYPNGLPSHITGHLENYMACFFENPFPSEELVQISTYRRDNALMTYGDDNCKATNYEPADNTEDLWRDELGIVMTDASKEGKLRWKTLDDVSFLKRRWRMIDGVENFVAQLDRKSMARMLLFKRESSLGDQDHAAVVMSEFMREMVYYGRDEYDKYASLARETAVELGLDTNPYFVVKTFDDRLGEVNAGTFQTWSVREPVERADLLAGGGEHHKFIYESMSSVSLVNGASAVPEVLPLPEVIAHDTGVLETPGGGLVANRSTNVVAQQMPVNSLDEFFGRAVLVSTVNLTTANSYFSQPLALDVWHEWKQNPAVAQKLAKYAYIRGTLQVILVPSFPGGAYGNLAVTCLPNGYHGGGVAPDLYFPNVLQPDFSAMIDVRESNKLVFQLPFIGDTDYKLIQGTGNDGVGSMWRLYMTVMAPLRTALPGGATAGTIQVYASLIDYEVAVPHFEGRKLIANHALKTLAPEVHETIGDGKGSAALLRVAAVAENLAKVPVIGSIAGGVGLASRAAAAVMGFFGFTVEHEFRNPKPCSLRAISNTAACEGVSFAAPAALTMNPLIASSGGDIGFTEEDQLAFGALFPRPTLVAHAGWDVTDPILSPLVTVPVCPGYCWNATTETVIKMHPTVPGFVGLPFSHWRGSMKYKIVVSASAFHRGVLQISWIPNGSLYPNDDVTNLTLNTLFDIAETNTKEIEIGFSREKPLLENRYFTDDSMIKPYGACNGYFSITPVTPLVSPNSGAVVSILVYAMGGDDLEFQYPRDTFMYDNIGFPPGSIPISFGVVLEGVDLPEGTGNEVDCVALVPKPMVYPTAEILSGETVGSVRQLLQKPSKLNVRSVNGIWTMPTPIWTPGANVDSWNMNVWTWAGHYGSMYLGLSGSERIKLLVRSDPALSRPVVGAARVYQTLPYMEDISPTMCPVAEATAGAQEFLIPNYGTTKYRFTRMTTPGNVPGPKIALQCEGDGPHLVVPYHSYGPDVRATMFRQIPRVAINFAGPSGWKRFW